jgi:hypothetical protein
MNQRKNNRSRQVKSKRYGKIMRCSFHTKPVFDKDSCMDFSKNINRDADNNCRNCKYSL